MVGRSENRGLNYKEVGAMRYYHMIIEPKDGGTRKEYISTRQGEAPEGWRCVGVCGYHDKPREVQKPYAKEL